MYTEKEIADLFRGGRTKLQLVSEVYFQAKSDKAKITKEKALNIVEQAILNDYLEKVSHEKTNI